MMIMREHNRVFRASSLENKPVILVMTRSAHLSETVMEYSIGVAERLNHRLLVAYINTLPFLCDGGFRNRKFAAGVQENKNILSQLGEKRGVVVSSVKENGKVSKVASRLCRTLKTIEFIIVDRGIKMDEVVAHAPVPVFNVCANDS
jgi:hypothetical protein